MPPSPAREEEEEEEEEKRCVVGCSCPEAKLLAAKLLWYTVS
eukprot:COSAG02_NODE_1420_length_12692_cov_3.543397_1_plen_42_part_00